MAVTPNPNYIETPADLQAMADLTAADWQRTLDRWTIGRFKADYDGTEVRINTSWIPGYCHYESDVDAPGLPLHGHYEVYGTSFEDDRDKAMVGHARLVDDLTRQMDGGGL